MLFCQVVTSLSVNHKMLHSSGMLMVCEYLEVIKFRFSFYPPASHQYLNFCPPLCITSYI